ncbi:MAG: carboxypeptidase regulatory-like domain-containing protein [Bryobacteraceae bacterium]
MKTCPAVFAMLIGVLLSGSPALNAQPKLVQTIDLSKWTGIPVSIVQPAPPVPAPGFSLTSVAYNPLTTTLYVADYATTNVYAIASGTNSVTSAVYTNGLGTSVDIGPTQNLPGTAPKVVLTNPVTGRWLFMGQGGGGTFSGTTYAEGVNARAFQSGGAWDPVSDNVYAADGMEFFANNNLKFLFGGYPCAGSSNAVAVNPMTSRVYVSCGNSQTGGGIVIYDGLALSKANAKIPTAPLSRALLGAQPTGLAINPNTNRVYVAGLTSPTSLDVLDASTYQLLASMPGLPDQSADYMIAGFNLLPLPRPVAVNTLTNTIFVVNSVTSTISIFDGKTNRLTGTTVVPAPAGAVVSQPLPPGTQMYEPKPGNSFYNLQSNLLTTLGGAISIAVNEAANTLYVASVNGTIGVYALDPPAAPAAFSVNGFVRDQQGLPVPGIAVAASGIGGNATAVSDANGLFVLTGLPAGTYTVTPSSVAFAFSPASQSVSITNANLGGLAFQANPPIVPASYTLSPWSLIGPGVSTTATVTLNQPAPAGGAVLTLGASDLKAVKVPSKLTVAAGLSSISFSVQGGGVSATTSVTLTAQYNGGTTTATVKVAPGDKITNATATYSRATQLLTVSATGSNAQATLNVSLAATNQLLGTMTDHAGSYTFQLKYTAGTPSSVNIVSNLGAKSGVGVKVTP